MENDPFIDDFPIKTSIYGGFSMAMLNNQTVPADLAKSMRELFIVPPGLKARSPLPRRGMMLSNQEQNLAYSLTMFRTTYIHNMYI